VASIRGTRVAKSEDKSDEDLTIEEILSSIRKIISEDEEDVLDLTDVVDDDRSLAQKYADGDLNAYAGVMYSSAELELESPPEESRETLEGFVSAMLKPMLKEWLDLNLPNIVQRSVEAEIARMTRDKK